MAAQGGGKASAHCEKCFAMVPAGMHHCPDCGAPIHDREGTAEDAATYPEIAKANLLRMRGDYRAAEEVCLGVLKKYPNHHTAHTLLGDIAVARGDWEQGSQWYELALDICPESTIDRERLDACRKRLSETEVSSAAEHLGLPDARPKNYLALGLALGATIMLAAASYVYLTRASGGEEVAGTSRSVNNPVILPDDPLQDPGTVRERPNPAVARPTEDIELAKAIAAKAPQPDGSRLLEATSDPANKMVTLTYVAHESDDEALVGARLAKTALDAYTELERVNVRAVRNQVLIFTATGTREALASTQSQEWKTTHGDDQQAWVNAFLTSKWRPKQGGEETPVAEPPPGDSTTDDAAPAGDGPGQTPQDPTVGGGAQTPDAPGAMPGSDGS